jgi:hypothetical protein
VLSLYAKGLTTGEISAHFAEIYGASVSKETISRITDKVLEEMNDWAVRPLDSIYAAVFIDGDRGQGPGRAGREPAVLRRDPWPVNATSSGCGPGPVAKARSSGCRC